MPVSQMCLDFFIRYDKKKLIFYKCANFIAWNWSYSLAKETFLAVVPIGIPCL